MVFLDKSQAGKQQARISTWQQVEPGVVTWLEIWAHQSP